MTRSEIAEVNARLPAGFEINSFDMLVIKRIHEIDTESRFYRRPKFGSAQYTAELVEWIVDQHGKDARFFATTRAEYARRRNARPRS